MRYKPSDKVRIKSIDWYNENKDKFGNIRYKRDGSAYPVFFSKYMSNFCGEILTIKSVFNHSYHMNETSSCEFWTDEMIEGLVEEENLIERVDDNGLPFNEWLSHKGFFYVPGGYELKDENGNVINATKIVLEKKKKEYPKTYEECAEVLDVCSGETLQYGDLTLSNDYEFNLYTLLENFRKLLICRDAYWKIAGEENKGNIDYVICNVGGKIISTNIPNSAYNHILIFPTEEMRDAFYENFKELIESVKELL